MDKIDIIDYDIHLKRGFKGELFKLLHQSLFIYVILKENRFIIDFKTTMLCII